VQLGPFLFLPAAAASFSGGGDAGSSACTGGGGRLPLLTTRERDSLVSTISSTSGDSSMPLLMVVRLDMAKLESVYLVVSIETDRRWLTIYGDRGVRFVKAL
jgi:hypothetical protein